jgi:hypothetical protein
VKGKREREKEREGPHTVLPTEQSMWREGRREYGACWKGEPAEIIEFWRSPEGGLRTPATTD